MTHTVVVAGIVADRRNDPPLFLATRRSYPAELAGQWEFPGGKVEPGEDPVDALTRELAEELGITARVGEQVPGPAAGDWPINQQLALRVFWAETDQHDLLRLGEGHDRLAWLPLAELPRLHWLPADRPLVEQLARG